jgi:hypothetical protein
VKEPEYSSAHGNVRPREPLSGVPHPEQRDGARGRDASALRFTFRAGPVPPNGRAAGPPRHRPCSSRAAEDRSRRSSCANANRQLRPDSRRPSPLLGRRCARRVVAASGRRRSSARCAVPHIDGWGRADVARNERSGAPPHEAPCSQRSSSEPYACPASPWRRHSQLASTRFCLALRVARAVDEPDGLRCRERHPKERF